MIRPGAAEQFCQKLLHAGVACTAEEANFVMSFVQENLQDHKLVVAFQALHDLLEAQENMKVVPDDHKKKVLAAWLALRAMCPEPVADEDIVGEATTQKTERHASTALVWFRWGLILLAVLAAFLLGLMFAPDHSGKKVGELQNALATATAKIAALEAQPKGCAKDELLAEAKRSFELCSDLWRKQLSEPKAVSPSKTAEPVPAGDLPKILPDNSQSGPNP